MQEICDVAGKFISNVTNIKFQGNREYFVKLKRGRNPICLSPASGVFEQGDMKTHCK